LNEGSREKMPAFTPTRDARAQLGAARRVRKCSERFRCARPQLCRCTPTAEEANGVERLGDELQEMARRREVKCTIAFIHDGPAQLSATMQSFAERAADFTQKVRPPPQFAKEKKLPLVRWKQKLSGPAVRSLEPKALAELYDEEPGLWGYFVKGAPCVVQDNIARTKGIVNGTEGEMHSITRK
jgi:hypothetical protein